MVLEDATAVLHCAGPFTRTAAPMVEACLRTGTHYLDITGEIDVFEAAHDRDSDAEEAGVMLLPGTGFDVVPDGLSRGAPPRATPGRDRTRTRVRGRPRRLSRHGQDRRRAKFGSGGKVRRDGRIVGVPSAHATRRVDFGWGRTTATAAAIPWGDVSTAYHTTTGIPERHRLHVDAAVGGALAAGGGLSRPCSGSTR